MENGLLIHPVFAAGFGDFGTVIFILIAIIYSVLNALGSSATKRKPPANPMGKQPQRPRRPANPQLQNEIDKFLTEITGQKPQQRKPVAKPAAQKARRATPPAARRPMPARQSSSRQPSSRPPARPASGQTQRKPGKDLASRRGPGRSNLGSEVTEHLATHMRTHVAEEAKEYVLDHDVDESVSEHLGIFAAEKPAGAALRAQRASIAPLVGLLRNPRGMRQVIIASEILKRPQRK